MNELGNQFEKSGEYKIQGEETTIPTTSSPVTTTPKSPIEEKTNEIFEKIEGQKQDEIHKNPNISTSLEYNTEVAKRLDDVGEKTLDVHSENKSINPQNELGPRVRLFEKDSIIAHTRFLLSKGAQGELSFKDKILLHHFYQYNEERTVSVFTPEEKIAIEKQLKSIFEDEKVRDDLDVINEGSEKFELLAKECGIPTDKLRKSFDVFDQGSTFYIARNSFKNKIIAFSKEKKGIEQLAKSFRTDVSMQEIFNRLWDNPKEFDVFAKECGIQSDELKVYFNELNRKINELNRQEIKNVLAEGKPSNQADVSFKDRIVVYQDIYRMGREGLNKFTPKEREEIGRLLGPLLTDKYMKQADNLIDDPEKLDVFADECGIPAYRLEETFKRLNIKKLRDILTKGEASDQKEVPFKDRIFVLHYILELGSLNNFSPDEKAAIIKQFKVLFADKESLKEKLDVMKQVELLSTLKTSIATAEEKGINLEDELEEQEKSILAGQEKESRIKNELASAENKLLIDEYVKGEKSEEGQLKKLKLKTIETRKNELKEVKIENEQMNKQYEESYKQYEEILLNIEQMKKQQMEVSENLKTFAQECRIPVAKFTLLTDFANLISFAADNQKQIQKLNDYFKFIKDNPNFTPTEKEKKIIDESREYEPTEMGEQESKVDLNAKVNESKVDVESDKDEDYGILMDIDENKPTQGDSDFERDMIKQGYEKVGEEKDIGFGHIELVESRLGDKEADFIFKANKYYHTVQQHDLGRTSPEPLLMNLLTDPKNGFEAMVDLGKLIKNTQGI